MLSILFLIYALSAAICAAVFAISSGGDAKVTFLNKEVASPLGKVAFYCLVPLTPLLNTYAAGNYVVQFWQQIKN